MTNDQVEACIKLLSGIKICKVAKNREMITTCRQKVSKSEILMWIPLVLSSEEDDRWPTECGDEIIGFQPNGKNDYLFIFYLYFNDNLLTFRANTSMQIAVKRFTLCGPLRDSRRNRSSRSLRVSFRGFLSRSHFGMRWRRLRRGERIRIDGDGDGVPPFCHGSK